MAQKAVKCMRRSTCERMSGDCSHRPSRIPTDGFHERQVVDVCDVVGVRGNTYWWLVAVDQHTDKTVIAPCLSHESQAVAKHMYKHWTRWAGPPDVLVYESGAWEPRRFGDSGANHSRIFSVAEGSSRAQDRQDDFATPGGGEECHGCRQQRSCQRTEPKSREVGHSPSDTSFRPPNEGLRRTDGTWGGRSSSEGGGTMESSSQDVSLFRRPHVKLWKNMSLPKRSGEQLRRVPSQ